MKRRPVLRAAWRLGFVTVGGSDFERFPGVGGPSTRSSADAALLRGAVNPRA